MSQNWLILWTLKLMKLWSVNFFRIHQSRFEKHLLNRLRSLFINFRFTLLMSALILVASLLPGDSFPRVSWSDMISLDKWVHFFFYFILSFICRMEWNKIPPRYSALVTSWVVWLLVSVYGGGIESLQWLMNTDRYFEVLDIIANIIGSMAGLLTFHGLKKM